jgi:YebC/PmpR family DNA-binding regulatory protein
MEDAMSGHNKWSTIKHRKGAQDAKRSKIFTKLIKELTIAARLGGGDAEGNPRLRTAVGAARAANMPKDNMDRAIKKGTGELEGVSYEEATYEGYGPGGVAVIIETLSDNKKRTVAEVRHILSKHGGNLGETGSVAWQFDRRGYIAIELEKIDEDSLMEIALDAGADDIQESGDLWEVFTDTADLNTVQSALEEKGIAPAEVKLGQFPKTTVELGGKKAEQMMKLIDALEDSDDIQNVFSNFDLDEETLKAMS